MGRRPAREARRVLQVSSMAPADCCHLRCLRRRLGQLGQAAADLRATTKLLTDPTDAYHKITMMYYDMGDAQESLK